MPQKIKILFIEDNEDHTQLALRLLKKEDYDVEWQRVETAESMCEALQLKDWDLVISDYSMPNFSGIDALQIYKDHNLDIPFILVSGTVGEDIAIGMLKTGAHDYIMKDKLNLIVPAIARELKDFSIRQERKAFNEELIRTQKIVSQSPITLWQWNAVRNSPVLYVSENVRQWGYNSEDFTSGRILFKDIIHPDDVERILPCRQKFIAEHIDSYDLEYRIFGKDGSIHWVIDQTTIIRKPDKEIDYIQGLLIDITGKKLADDKIVASEKRFKELMENMELIAVILDTDGKIQFCNQYLLKLTGWKFGEIINQNWFDVFIPKDSDLKTRVFDQLKHNEMQSYGENEILTKERQQRSIAWSNTILRETDGHIIGVASIGQDITDRIRFEKELQESEVRFRSAFENAPIGMELISLTGSLMRVNKAFCELTGFTKDELAKANFRDFTHPDDLIDNENYVQQLISGAKDTISFEKRYVRKDGKIIWVNVSSSMFKNTSGVPQYFIAQVEDITHRKQVAAEILTAKEKAEESDRLKSALMANMSHELRTPMNGVLGFTELIMHSPAPDDIKDMAHMIDLSGKRLLQTLDSIILLAQLQSGAKSLTVSSQALCLSEELKNLAKAMEGNARDKGLDYIVDIKEGIYSIVEPKLLRNAVSILIDNAIKYTQKGFIRISLATGETDGEKKVCIKVQDTGIGIPDGYKDSVFEEFRQVSEGYGRNYEGIGIGLTITKRIVELFKGQITLESATEVGSTFTIELPLHQTEDSGKISEQVVPDKAQIPHPTESYTDLRFLIVEDNMINTNLLVHFLRDYCSRIDCASTGESAVDMAKTHIYDAILMDINLGAGMDGLQATSQIRQFKGYESIPIIAVTGYTMIGDKERMLSSGCSGYIGKPFTQDAIINTLQDALPCLKSHSLNNIKIDQSQRLI